MYDQINEFDLLARNSIGEQREDKAVYRGRTLINEETSALNQIFFEAPKGTGCKKGAIMFFKFHLRFYKR